MKRFALFGISILGWVLAIGLGALAFLAVGMWGRNRGWYRQRVVVPASATIAPVGMFWTVQRLIER